MAIPAQFHLETGPFAVEYDSSKGNYLRIHRIGQETPAYRVTCAPGQGLYPLDEDSIRKIEPLDQGKQSGVRIVSSREWADFVTDIDVSREAPGLVHWRVEITLRTSAQMTDTDFDCLFAEANPHVTDTASGDPRYGVWTPAPLPLLYFFDANMDASVLFYSDYTSLNSFFELSDARPNFNVNLDMAFQPHSPYQAKDPNTKGFGFYRPVTQRRIPAGHSFVIADSYCLVNPGIPQDDAAEALRFLKDLAAIYPRMRKPETEYTEWRDIAAKVIEDVQKPQCWTVPLEGGRRHLLPYVNQRNKRATTFNTECEILVPLIKYNRYYPELGSKTLEELLLANLRDYYDPETQNLTNVMRRTRSVLDTGRPRPVSGAIAESTSASLTRAARGRGRSEDRGSTPTTSRQGGGGRHESWRAGHNIFMYARLVSLGQTGLEEDFRGATEGMRDVGRALGYEFPRRYDHVARQGLEDSNRTWWQRDVGGALGYALLQRYSLTGEKEYLEDAKAAVESISGQGLCLTHEIQCAAAGTAACGWLYQITGDKHYLDLSYIALANVLRRGWFWECDYEYGRFYKTFFGLCFSGNGPHIAPMEYMIAWTMMRDYYYRVAGQIPKELEVLLPECQKWAPTISRSFYPPFLPKEIVSAGPADWPNDPTLYLALEDVDGINLLGTSGQAIYMSGPAIELAVEMYHPLDEKLVLFSEYPVLSKTWDKDSRSLEFRLGGLPDYTAQIRLDYRGGLDAWGKPVTLFYRAKGQWKIFERLARIDDKTLGADLPGGSEIRVVAGEKPLLDFVTECLTTLGTEASLPSGQKDQIRRLASQLTRSRTADAIPVKDLAELAGLLEEVQASSGARVPAQVQEINLATDRILNAFFGITLDFDLESPIVSSPDKVRATVRVNNRGSREVNRISLDLDLPAGWSVEGQKSGVLERSAPLRPGETQTWDIALKVPDQLPSGVTYTLRARATCQVDGGVARATAEAGCTIAEAWKFSASDGNPRFGQAGERVEIRAELENHTGEAIALPIQIQAPAGWEVTLEPPLPIKLGARQSIPVRVLVTPSENAAPGYSEVTLTGRWNDREALVACPLEIVKPVEGFLDTMNDASLWETPKGRRWESQTDEGRQPGPLTLENGMLRVSNRIIQREVCINLDKYPHLTVSKPKGGSWFLYLDDGRRGAHPGIRLEQGDGGSGLYHYDLPRSTGWRGIARFVMRFFVQNDEGYENTVWYDWMAIAARPLENQPTGIQQGTIQESGKE